jgi:serine/threonine-protein kinase RsbW
MEREAIVFNDTAAPVYGAPVYEREFPSEPHLIPAVVHRLAQFLVDAGFASKEQRNPLSLCFDEALKNAVLHGNESVASRLVSIVVYRCADCFWVVVGDEGGGFDPEDIPDPFDENGLWRESGRGVHLMRHYATALEFWGGGSTLALRFPLADTAVAR